MSSATIDLQSQVPVKNVVVHVTGKVLPVGNGAVGKSSLAKILLSYDPEISNYIDIIKSIRRTNNLEFEYLNSKIYQGNTQYSIVSQLLIPPGQKESEDGRNGRTFDQVIDIYRFVLSTVDVIILTYNLSDRDSFLDLKYWLNASGDLLSSTTNILMVGTHLDQAGAKRKVTPGDIEKGMFQVQNFFNRKIDNWQGACFPIEVSSLTGKNIDKLEFLISKSILWSHGYLTAEDFVGTYQYLTDNHPKLLS